VQGSTEEIRQKKVLVVGISEPSEHLTDVAARENSSLKRWPSVWEHACSGNEATACLLQELEEAKLPIVAATITTDSPFAQSVACPSHT
jgi:hypothetical protein